MKKSNKNASIKTPVEMQLDNSPRVRRILQMISDQAALSGKSIKDLRVLDLACAHGQYALEIARRGGTSIGIEGRQAWVDHANLWKRDLGITKADIIFGDVRDLNREQHGAFDVVLCLGLLYHLDDPDCLELLDKIQHVCDGFAIIDTQIATNQVDLTDTEWRGNTYRGWKYREHLPNASNEQKASTLGASLDDEFSYWLTRSSLVNALTDVGFSTVYECRAPLDCMYAHGEVKIHADFVTMLAIKGDPIGDFIGNTAGVGKIARWPEDIEIHTLQRPWSKK